MAKSLLAAKKKLPQVDGVLLAHDDLFFNLTMMEEHGFPSKDTIFAQRLLNSIPPISHSGPIIKFYPNCSYWMSGKAELSEFDCNDIDSHWSKIPFMPEWVHQRNCLKNFLTAVFANNGKAFESFGNPQDDRSISFYAMERSDFVYVPTKHTSFFAPRAQWLAKHQVFLECAMPTLLLHLNDERKAPIRQLPTANDEWTRKVYAAHAKSGNGTLLKTLVDYPEPYGILHPMKLSGIKRRHEWGDILSYVATGAIPQQK